MSENVHTPVLLDKILEFCHRCIFHKTKRAFDGTFGGGGYTKNLLASGYQVYASDLDTDVLTLVEDIQEGKYKQAFHFKNDNFLHYISDIKDDFLDLVVLDLGFSSNQLETGDRGFSYFKDDQNFDLRFNVEIGIPAYKILKKFGKYEDLQHILFRYSGEKLSKRIAHHLFLAKDRIKTVKEVKDVVISAIPPSMKKNTYSILSRVWQAMRIHTNRELEVLEKFLPVALKKLRKHGLLTIVCFHSLEEKVVTNFMRKSCKSVFTDEYGNNTFEYKLLTPKKVIPSVEELLDNNRSRSASLRVLQKLID